MTKIIELVIFFAIIAFLTILSIKLYKRIYLLRIMRRLSKVKEIEIKRVKNPFSSLFILSKTPEYIVKIYENTYIVRCYNGGSAVKAVHFASDKFTVRYSKLKATSYRPGVGRISKPRGIGVGASVRLLHPVELPAELKDCEYTEVIIFNPAPSEVSFVVKEKNSIRAAFTGDTVCGRKIFTASTFEIFADREARRIRIERQTGQISYNL